MIHYSIIPLEDIMYEDHLFNPEYKTIKFSSCWLVVTRCGDSQKIVRVISSNPNDYLSPELQPGNVFKSDNII